MSTESKTTFFRQSGWLILSTTLSGVFLVAIYSVVNHGMKDDLHQVGVFISLLRLFLVLAIPSAGLQVVMAQEAAAAITPERERNLAVTARSVMRGIFAVWALIVIVCVWDRARIISALKIENPASLWITLGLVLGALCLPVMQGLLQGTQKFSWLGWSIMLNGLGRFFGVALLVLVFKTKAAGALFGALIGIAAAVIVGYWPSRFLFRAAQGQVDWKRWLGRVLPLTGGVGSSLFLMNADVIFVQSHFDANLAPLYSAVAVLGAGLVYFTAPLSAVMFPKLVRSFARSEKSNSLFLAMVGTAILGAMGAVACTLLPELPLRIIHFNNPNFWKSSVLVPWFMWAMLPLTVANVLVNSLMAREKFSVVPWLMGLAIGYGWSLHAYLQSAVQGPHYDAFKGVILRLGIFSLLFLAVVLIFSLLDSKKEAPR